MSKKNKFDLTYLVHQGVLKEGEEICFVSDPTKTCKIVKLPNGEYKVTIAKEILTIHAVAQRWLGVDPPEHASKWVRQTGAAPKTLYELWHNEEGQEAA